MYSPMVAIDVTAVNAEALWMRGSLSGAGEQTLAYRGGACGGTSPFSCVCTTERRLCVCNPARAILVRTQKDQRENYNICSITRPNSSA